MSALREEVKEDKDHRKETIEKIVKKDVARDEILARVAGLEINSTKKNAESSGSSHELIGLENNATKGTAESTGPSNETTNITSTETGYDHTLLYNSKLFRCMCACVSVSV